MHLVVTVPVPGPGGSLATAVTVADALDTRRVPLTLLVGPRPHPDTAEWVRARRRVGDVVLLHGTGSRAGDTPDARLPEHEARLHLAGARRRVDALGVTVDGFASPGWTVSDGVRRALAAAGIDLLVDETGVHRLDAGGTRMTTCRGTLQAHPSGRRPRRRRTGWTGWTVDLVHVDAGLPGALDAVDAALAAGHVPASACGLVARTRATTGRLAPLGDPESWSITA